MSNLFVLYQIGFCAAAGKVLGESGNLTWGMGGSVAAALMECYIMQALALVAVTYL